MTRQRAAVITATCLSIFTILSAQGRPPQQSPRGVRIPEDVRGRAERNGRVRVLVELQTLAGGHVAEGSLPGVAAVAAQRSAAGAARSRVLAKLAAGSHRVIRQYETVPYLALEVTPAALAVLESSPSEVVRVFDDAILRPVLADSVPLIQADQAWTTGYDGTGTTVAVVDTGVEAGHTFFGGRVVEEACYSSTVAGTSVSFCPNGLDEQIGAGAAAPCFLGDCIHGTHVAGIAAGNGALSGQPFSGVAKNADVMAVQVFSEIVDPMSCGGLAPCAGAFSSDIIAGLERVYAVAAQRNVVAVNMSLGGGDFAAFCDDQPYKPAIDNLRSIGVASVVASGNSGWWSMLSSPACISSAVSVGSVDKNDVVSWFSNVASFLSLLAPGNSITSSVPGGGFQALSGTSMAAPHVTGSWALMRQAVPGAGVGTILNALRQTGRPIVDTRFFGTATTPRVRVFEAIASIAPVTNPSPSVTSVSPARVRAGGPATVTVNGAGFDAFSVVLWNGSAKPTTVLNSTQLQAVIPASDLAVGTAQVAVFTPAPGGGTSSPLTVGVDPPAILTVNTTTVAAGAQATVTLTNGYGGQNDWFALAATGSANTTYLQWNYVGNGVTTRTWTVTMPTTLGTYEFRLFLNNGYTRAATSPTITVVQPTNPVPAITSISPTAGTTGGSAFTLTVFGTGLSPASIVRWNGADRPTTYVGSTQLRATIPASDLTAPGTAQVTVFSPAPGGGLSSALPFTIGLAPALAVSTSTAAPGGNVTVTLTNGFGGANDWLALASTTAPNTSYLQWVYVGGGVATRTWTVAMPQTPGPYEFRLFLNNGFTLAATSPTVNVVVTANPVPSLTSLSPSATPAGNSAFTMTVNGTGFATSSVVRWNGANRTTTFVSPNQLSAAIPASDVSAVGTAAVTVFSPAPGGGLSNALSFTIGQSPTITVSATSVAPGTNVTMTLTNGLGGGSDWLALASTTAPNTSYIRYLYVGGGVTTKTWTVAMPTTPGTYEFRLFLNNGFVRAATSPTITVTP